MIKLRTDGSQAFAGKFSDLLIQYNIEHVYPGPRPQSNGQSEVHARIVSVGAVGSSIGHLYIIDGIHTDIH